ncbi:MAG: type II 3-dehydroquinate dehydratase [Gammaproteobacteria bacterium]|nr:type II 3-dehydroquinate dehydratase [Gammaproteobacteria bacterium]
MSRFLVIHGPNLNLLGMREPEIYGPDTLEDINSRLQALASAEGHGIETFQSNAEHELIERIHIAKKGTAAMLVNLGAFTHTSIALRDALVGVAVPFVEVHISNMLAREPFRRHSYLSDVAVGVVAGLGARGYELGLTFLMEKYG